MPGHNHAQGGVACAAPPDAYIFPAPVQPRNGHHDAPLTPSQWGARRVQSDGDPRSPADPTTHLQPLPASRAAGSILQQELREVREELRDIAQRIEPAEEDGVADARRLAKN